MTHVYNNAMEESYMAIKIGHASIDENAGIKNGASGDQTGREVCIRTWYAKPWSFVLRCTDEAKAEKMAAACEAGCGNPNIGYDQNQRNTLHTQAKQAGYDLSRITTPCETDCSAFICVCAEAAGITIPYNGTNAPTTSTMKTAFTATGMFEVLTASKYVTGDAWLKRGDILVKPGSHTVMALENGSMANAGAPASAAASQRKYSAGQTVTYSTCYKASTDSTEKAIVCNPYRTGTITKVLSEDVNNPYLINDGTCWINDGDIRSLEESSDTYSFQDFVKDIQTALGAAVDGIPGPETLSKTITVSASCNRRHAVVTPLQKYLNTIGCPCGNVDGIAGPKFTSAVKAFQKANGCVIDGVITARNKTWKKLLKLA